MSETKRQRLRRRLTQGPMIVAPGIYDAYGARFVEQAGFEAVYMTGNGVSASLLGRPDVGLIDLTLFASHAHRAAACVDIPLICDADTGYGNAVNVRLFQSTRQPASSLSAARCQFPQCVARRWNRVRGGVPRTVRLGPGSVRARAPHDSPLRRASSRSRYSSPSHPFMPSPYQNIIATRAPDIGPVYRLGICGYRTAGFPACGAKCWTRASGPGNTRVTRPVSDHRTSKGGVPSP